MAFDAGTTVASSASKQIESTTTNRPRRVKTVEFYARASNDTQIYIGPSTVASSDGRTLVAGATWTVTLETGSEVWGDFYLIGSSTGSSMQLDWTVIYED